jgi:hypothetical protein
MGIGKHLKKETSKSFSLPDTDGKNTDQQSPVFSMRHLAKSHCISRCNQEQKAAFADAMRNLSKMSWIQIRGAHRHGLGTEKIARNAIKAEIPPLITEDVTLLAFRFWKKAPMVGFRDKDVFHIVWFDGDFSLYDHGG